MQKGMEFYTFTKIKKCHVGVIHETSKQKSSNSDPHECWPRSFPTSALPQPYLLKNTAGFKLTLQSRQSLVAFNIITRMISRRHSSDVIQPKILLLAPTYKKTKSQGTLATLAQNLTTLLANFATQISLSFSSKFFQNFSYVYHIPPLWSQPKSQQSAIWGISYKQGTKGRHMG